MMALLLAPTYLLADHTHQNKTIHIVSDHWPGYTEPGAQGFYFQLIKQIFEPKGYVIEHRVVPFRRAISLMNQGEADMFLVDDHPKYLSKLEIYELDKLLHPKYPINYSLVTALYLPSIKLDWQDTRDNPNLTLAWVKGYGYNKTLGLPHQNIMHVNNTAQGLRLLQAGRIDSLIDDLSDISEALKQQEFSKLQLNREVVNKRNLYPLFYNNSLGQELAQIYDQGMQALLASGELYQLYQKMGINYQDVFKPKEYFSAVYDSQPAEGLSILVDGLESP